MTPNINVVLVGATGAVGQTMLRVLEQRSFPVASLRAVASARSAGSTVTFKGEKCTVEVATPEVFVGARLALFSAGAATAREWGPIAASKGCLVVDNSSAFRMDPDVPLVVPEVNGQLATDPPRGIIANPNCSTIQLVVALKPLHDNSGLLHVTVSTYQAISGKGARAVSEFNAQSLAVANGEVPTHSVLPGVLAGNLLCDWKHEANGWSEEELKVVAETRKIMQLPSLSVWPTCVRVPVVNAHSESVWARFERPITRALAIELLRRAPGVQVLDAVGPGQHPQPRDVSGQDDVFVGRLREDPNDPRALSLWVVGDNLRKGAALNAVQVAERAFGR